MAIWQLDMGLIPNAVVPDPPPEVEEALVKYGVIDTKPWWRSHQPPPDYRDIVSQTAPFYKQDHEELLWGKEEL